MSNDSYQVGPDTVVHFSYELFDEEGESVEASAVGESVAFLFGYGQLSPLLERALEGHPAGSETSVTLSAGDAFGPRDPERIIEVDRSDFPPDVAVGDEFSAEHESGEDVSLTVLEVLPELVVLDSNHPLAGQAVRICMRVEAVRPALSDEIAYAVEELESGDFDARGLLPAARLLRPCPPSDEPER